jgi:queuine/archaeosine tRNA-ribosyltransferase
MTDGVNLRARGGAALLEQLVALWEGANPADPSPLPAPASCPACEGVQRAAPRDIHRHLHSDAHRAMEEELVDRATGRVE